MEPGEIKSFVNRGRGGTFWLALRNNTNNKEVDDYLSKLGFSKFKGAFTKQIVPDNIDSKNSQN